MSSTRTMGISLTDVSTDQQLPLGFQYHQPSDSVNNYGERVWVYIFNDEASTGMTQGQVVYRDPSATTHDWWGGLIAPVTAHQAKAMVLGFVQHAIAAGSYGFILAKGVGSVKTGDGALTLDTPFTSGGATTVGTVLDYADDTDGANVGVLGHATTAITADTIANAWIDVL